MEHKRQSRKSLERERGVVQSTRRNFKQTPRNRLCRAAGVAPLGGAPSGATGGDYFPLGVFFLPLFSGM
jgi:hypothetical protein